MIKNTVLIALLVFAIFAGYSNSQNITKDSVTAASPQNQQAAAPVQSPQPGFQAGLAQNVPVQQQNPGVQLPNQQQNTMPMGGMGCMMGGMNMSGMSGMGGTGGMGHTMDQGLTMREIVYIVSMQDALQVLNDIIQFQEKVIENAGPKKEGMRKELAQMKEKTQKLASDYRSILTSQTR